ncbi:hypothetical protein ACT17_34355 [Mycolicibacterium conceptionense]|uniref:Uncharacterized protein n=1 Tax=Mycolicibacterium conceptionense TaxID=451644 RepID=A0A0J8TWW4_9MYCO|nr:hypothetical protein [Mycolicibacterium conceptionense]KMV13637.1 hypothetical protein ACT17_34355 [Mycolicibacterium conceptionense]
MGTATEGLATADYVRGIDTRLIKAQNAARGAERRMVMSATALQKLLGSPVEVELSVESLTWSFERAADELVTAARSAKLPYAARRQANGAVTQMLAERERAVRLQAQIAHLECVYAARGGWQRYYRGADGTLHLNTGCAALVLGGGARFMIPQLSGSEPQDVMAALGDQVRICTGCLRAAEDEARRAAADAADEVLAS